MNGEFYLNNLWNQVIDYIADNKLMDINLLNDIKETSYIYDLTPEKATIGSKKFVNAAIIREANAIFEQAIEVFTKLKVEITCFDEKILFASDQAEVNKPNFIKTKLNPDYVFENFVLGKSNIQSQFSAITVANNPGCAYNPLFIYGNSGLGKTHLLNAIGNKVRLQFPDYKVAIVSGLDFVEGVANSIKNRTIEDFKKEFYDLDVLLVDDIQFIAGKDKTHEVFFSVFNELINNRKQICITSDRLPNEIKGLESRIISRFNQGLSVTISTPEFETSVQILKKKLENSTVGNYNIDDDVLAYMATNFAKDVRQLEGALNRLLFYTVTFNPVDHITLKVALEAFKDQNVETTSEIDINSIKKAVCSYYGVTKDQLNSKIRTKNIATPRQVAMYLTRKILDIPYKDIGYNFGKRDHSTVINACEKVEENIKKDPNYLKALNEIEKSIK